VPVWQFRKVTCTSHVPSSCLAFESAGLAEFAVIALLAGVREISPAVSSIENRVTTTMSFTILVFMFSPSLQNFVRVAPGEYVPILFPSGDENL
jgi:hypothetical protein